MGIARFNNEGYEYLNDSSYVLFTADSSHFILFDYIASDLSCLPGLMEEYISKKINLTTLQLRSSEGGDDIIYKIQEVLRSCHPYYRYECEKVIVNAIGAFFNRLLVHIGFDRSRYPSGHVFQKQWYKDRLSALIPVSLLKNGEYPLGCSPEKLYAKYYDWVGCPPSINEDTIYEYSVSDILTEKPIPFSDELQTQVFTYNMLYFLLDSSAQGMGELNMSQRYWLFGNIFCSAYNQSKMSATRRLSFYTPAHFQAGKDRTQEVEYFRRLDDIFRPLHKLSALNICRDGIPKDIDDFFVAATKCAGKEMDAKIFEEYEIDSLQQLLYIEVMFMLQVGATVKKCKNCNKYFVPANRRKAYCDRTDTSGKRCSDVGSKQSYQRKMKQEPALEIYNRAYKTHNARTKRGRMSQSEFEAWCTEAREKLEQVRAGELAVSAFQEWLSR